MSKKKSEPIDLPRLETAYGNTVLVRADGFVCVAGVDYSTCHIEVAGVNDDVLVLYVPSRTAYLSRMSRSKHCSPEYLVFRIKSLSVDESGTRKYEVQPLGSIDVGRDTIKERRMRWAAQIESRRTKPGG
jgi:hypothetical protein